MAVKKKKVHTELKGKAADIFNPNDDRVLKNIIERNKSMQAEKEAERKERNARIDKFIESGKPFSIRLGKNYGDIVEVVELEVETQQENPKTRAIILEPVFYD